MYSKQVKNEPIPVAQQVRTLDKLKIYNINYEVNILGNNYNLAPGPHAVSSAGC